MRFDSSDILAVLRKFKIADDDNSPRQIENIKKLKPHDKNALIRFRFNGRSYALLIDNLAEDDEQYIYEQTTESGVQHNYTLINNPLDNLMSFGMPYRGKDCYLLVDEPTEKRLDIALVERFGEQSRSTYQKMILAGLVSVNGVIKTSPKQLVKLDDKIALTQQKIDIRPLDYDVIYEDDDIVVINKPAGMLTHAKGAMQAEFTAADIVKPKTSYQSESMRPGIVHRLDRDTSGVLLMVKNEAAAHNIRQQFSNRTVKKTYHAIVSGVPKPTEAMIDLPIERNPSAPSTFRVGPGGKTAQTVYKVTKSNISQIRSLVELKPRTGRTHQLRVHMQYIGTPILGDVVYGVAAAERMFLHAYSLELALPNGERRIFTAPMPPEFNQQVET